MALRSRGHAVRRGAAPYHDPREGTAWDLAPVSPPVGVPSGGVAGAGLASDIDDGVHALEPASRDVFPLPCVGDLRDAPPKGILPRHVAACDRRFAEVVGSLNALA
eukprot:459489-Pyramimonas_sp.AAC.1